MAKGPISPVSLIWSECPILALRAASAAKMLATCYPARLNALLGEVQVTERRSNYSQSEANGV